MIDKIAVNNFKCFEDLELSLSNLNVLSGLNSMGKSTAIQALLLLKQSQEQDAALHHLVLNGDYISLGVGKDILYENSDNEQLQFRFEDQSGRTIATVDYAQDQDILSVTIEGERIIVSLNSEFEYISAGRLSPQTIYEKSSLYVDNKSQLGVNGQYTAHYLAQHQDDIVGISGYTLKDTIQQWLNIISPNVRLNISSIPNADLAQIAYYYSGFPNAIKSSEYRPTNVGFGISYVLPVIIALLKAKPGSILVIENPEAHLHPRGQRKIGELIAQCAAYGVQIFLETHSDHVLNGIRIFVKQGKLDAGLTRLFFFDRILDGNKIKHTVVSPRILPNGKLDIWPEGFFDEWEKALDEIV